MSPGLHTGGGRPRIFPPLPPRTDPDAPFAATWWGNAWIAALEDSALDPARLARGRAYAREGHVDTITVAPGRIVAYVHGSRPRPYRAELRMRTLTPEDWDRLLDAATADPAHLTALLTRDMPHALAATADHTGVPLLPGRGDLVPSCTCPDRGHPCKHAAALTYQTARILDADPFVLFLVRGGEETRVLEELTRRNARAAAEEATGRRTPPAGAGFPRTEGSARTEGSPRTEVKPPQTDGTSPRTDARPPGTDTRPPGTDARPPHTEAEPSATPTPPPPHTPDEAVAVGEPVAADLPGIPAREALATDYRPPLPPPLPAPPRPGEPPLLPALPGAPDPAALEFLATDAAARAHAYLTRGAPPRMAPDPWHDAVRLAASHPGLTGRRTFSRQFAALAESVGRTPADLSRAAAAWRQGGEEGLTVLESPWDPPAGPFDRARGALTAADLPRMTIHHNHLTDPTGTLQLRYGHDGRWYPYRGEPGATHTDWWPEGEADEDPVGAFAGLLAS